MRAIVLAALAVTACRDAAPPAGLDGYLGALAGADEASRTAAVAGWKLDAAGWARVTTDPYRAVYADYARAFDAAAPALVTRLAHGGAVHVRPHFAGDPKLTVGQARARWAQPVQAPSEVADLDDGPLDAVFVRDEGSWRIIVGIDVIVRARAARWDPDCGALLGQQIAGRCADAAWVIAEAALREDRGRFDHACTLARSLCPFHATPPP